MKILIVGEAWGAEENLVKHPFVGASGQELFRMCQEAGLAPPPYLKGWISPRLMPGLWAGAGLTLTNVFQARPLNNDLGRFFSAKRNDKWQPFKMDGRYQWPRQEVEHHIEALYDKVQLGGFDLVLAAGACAAWAFGIPESIKKAQGYIYDTPLGRVMPVLHPAYIMVRSWKDRTPTVAYLVKARENPPTLDYVLQIEPTLHEALEFLAGIKSGDVVVFDTEFEAGIPYCIAFTHAQQGTMCIPLDDYWITENEQALVLKKVAQVLAEPTVGKVGQNGIADMMVLWRGLGMPVRGYIGDTLLQSHVLYPELEKNLGTLAARFLQVPYWKSMRATTTTKKDE